LIRPATGDEEVVSNIPLTVAEHYPDVLGAAFTDTLTTQSAELGAGMAEAAASGFVWARD
jgi:hypothetical protein